MRHAALTASGGRPEALALCCHYMCRQTRRPEVWYVVDDVGDVGETIDHYLDEFGSEWLADAVQVIRAPHTWAGQHTLIPNLLVGLGAVFDELGPDVELAIIEDDDWYSPEYLAQWEGVERGLRGEGCSRYFNVRTGRSKSLRNRKHCSMMSTVFVGPEVLRWFGQVLRSANDPFVDVRLWHNWSGRKTVRDAAHCVGIKGLPGRGGIGVGHRDGFGDPEGWDVLRRWIAEDAEIYERFSACASC